jgi:hypothetical protein
MLPRLDRIGQSRLSQIKDGRDPGLDTPQRATPGAPVGA